MRKYYAISIALHLVLSVAFLFQSNNTAQNSASSQGPNNIKVKTLTENEYKAKLNKSFSSKNLQIVEGDDQLKSQKAPDPTRVKTFLSKNNQVFDSNTRAKRVGKYKNVLKEGLVKKDLFKINPKLVDKTVKIYPIKVKSGKTSSFASRSPASLNGDMGEGFSASEDLLEGVAIGTQTLLNTHEYKYYSYFLRIRDQVKDIWQATIRNQDSEIRAQGAYDQSAIRKTKLKVRLSEEGEIIEIKAVAKSGYDALDNAAVDAFLEGAPYANPPRGLMSRNSDTLTIDWTFAVITNQNQGVNIRVQKSRHY